MFWPEHVFLDGCFSFKTQDLVYIWSCPDGLHKSYKYRGQFPLQKFKSIRTNALIKPFGNREPVYLFKFFYANVTSAV